MQCDNSYVITYTQGNMQDVEFTFGNTNKLYPQSYAPVHHRDMTAPTAQSLPNNE